MEQGAEQKMKKKKLENKMLVGAFEKLWKIPGNLEGMCMYVCTCPGKTQEIPNLLFLPLYKQEIKAKAEL